MKNALPMSLREQALVTDDRLEFSGVTGHREATRACDKTDRERKADEEMYARITKVLKAVIEAFRDW